MRKERKEVENNLSDRLKDTLSEDEMHRNWIRVYRNPLNAAFYENAFDRICSLLNSPQEASILDVGCGTCAQSMRLARRGFQVLAIDFSPVALKKAETEIRSAGLQDRITLRREDILSLTLGDDSFEYLLCWGVLMHIADLERAISELVRVCKPGGRIIISEGNMSSLQSRLLRVLKKAFRLGKSRLVRSREGYEFWESTASGILLTRQADIRWLVRRFKEKGCSLEHHFAGQFTELYSVFHSTPATWSIHKLNDLYFRYIEWPAPAFGNVCIFRKEQEGNEGS